MMKKQTVFVGLSGGVDSSVTAALLLDAGYEVVGVFIKVWHPDFLVCNWESERVDAMRVAAHLGIPFLTCDAEESYKTTVADYFIDSYRHGLTPNPDVLCNKEVKFGTFLSFAQAQGADFIATGHYARVTHDSGIPKLLRGVDATKDQSYFLWSLTLEQLSHTLFPIGQLEKRDVRKLATAYQLPTASKRDSQGVCFLGHIDIPQFLSHYITLTSGQVLARDGTVIGTHKGAFVYTVGQRHGFTITNSNYIGQVLYVVEKNVSVNTLIVDTKYPEIASGNVIHLRNVVVREPLQIGDQLTAQTRYRQAPFAVRIEKQSNVSLVCRVMAISEAPAMGQSCVLYQDQICLGGGIIEQCHT